MITVALPIDVYSPDQLSDLLLEVQDIAGALRDQKVRDDDDTVQRTPELSTLLKLNNITDDSDTLETLAKELEVVLNKAPTVHVLLSAMPNRPLRRQIVEWFRSQIHADTLLTFAARSDLGGGAIIQVGSHLYDLSFRRSILDNKARLTEIAGV